MDKISIWCVSTNKDAVGDVMERSSKRIKAALENTDIIIELSRSDTRRPYIGFAAGMEFETFGTLDD